MPASDFDFLPGRWTVANHRRVDPLDPACGEWTTFTALVESRPILGGVGNTDHFHVAETGYEGYALRLYEPQADAWRIWWASNARPAHLDPPVEGRFDEAGDGRFLGEDEVDGVPVEVRFEWTRTTTANPRWEQSFSVDGGETWVPNWVMELRRRA